MVTSFSINRNAVSDFLGVNNSNFILSCIISTISKISHSIGQIFAVDRGDASV